MADARLIERGWKNSAALSLCSFRKSSVRSPVTGVPACRHSTVLPTNITTGVRMIGTPGATTSEAFLYLTNRIDAVGSRGLTPIVIRVEAGIFGCRLVIRAVVAAVVDLEQTVHDLLTVNG